MAEVAFDVLDAGAGLVRLEKRSPTLDGGVPVRVARGCDPLLEGNAYGFQLALARPLVVRRPLGSLAVELAGPEADGCTAALRAAPARLAACGVVPAGGAWERRLARGFSWVERRPARAAGPLLRLWTGLCVRPRPGVWLRLSSAANRRNHLVAVRETWFADDARWVPLVVDLSLAKGALRLEGEIACLGALAPDARFAEVALSSALDVGRAHATFYDAAYFAKKKGQITGKYRRLVASLGLAAPRGEPAAASAAAANTAEIVAVGPRSWAVERAAHVLGPEAIEPRACVGAPGGSGPEWLRIDNAIAFRFAFDGHTLGLEPDAAALERFAATIERTWRAAYGSQAVQEDWRALLYLTKYFTPHPPGEPHFFVKPAGLLRTPRGWSTLVEGVQTTDYDILRGVVATDAFFATPAVFAVARVGQRVEVPRGAPLARAFCLPRSLLRAGYRSEPLADGLAPLTGGRAVDGVGGVPPTTAARHRTPEAGAP